MKKLSKQSFPSLRMRRLRSTDNIRRLVRETKLAPENLTQPIFLSEGKNKKEKIREEGDDDGRHDFEAKVIDYCEIFEYEE